jgi:Spy/CpxP family protein refolding chaperone
MRSIIRVAVMGIALAPAAALAFGHGHRLERMAAELQLDAKSKAQIKSIFDNSRAEAKALRTQVRQAKHRLHELLKQDMPRESEVLAQVDAVSALKAKLGRLRIKTLLRVRQLLTPAQRQKLRGLWESRRKAFQTACGADLQKLCPSIPEGFEGKHRAGRCLFHNQDKLSAGCRSLIQKHHGPAGPPPF